MSLITGHGGTAAALAGALMLGSLAGAGCGVVNEVNKIGHTVASNKATIDTFTTKLQSGEATPFEVKYVTTGSAPATIVYAVQPPKGLLFKESASSGGTGLPGTEIVVNGSGEYACTPPGSRARAVDLPEAGQGQRRRAEQDLRPLYRVALGYVPQDLRARGRLRR